MVPTQRAAAAPLDLFAAAGSAPSEHPFPPFPLRPVLRRKWTILAVFLLIAVPATTAIWLWGKPQYRARATVEISPTNPRILYKTEDNGLIPMYQQYLNSQVGIIASNKVLQRVVERKDLQETTWYQHAPWQFLTSADSPLERLRHDLEVQPRGRTFLIDIDFVATVPADARVIVDAVLEEFKAESQNRVKDTDMLVLGTLESTLGELEVSIAGREKVAEGLRRDIGTNTPQKLVSQKRLRLDELEARMQEVTRQLELAKWRRERLVRADAPDPTGADDALDAENAAAREEVLARRSWENDPEWLRLHRALQDARLQLDVEGQQRLGQAHPTMVRLKEQARLLEQQLNDRQDQLAQLAPLAAGTTSGAGGGLPEPIRLARRAALLEKEKALLEQALNEQRNRFAVEFEKARQLVRENEILQEQKSKASIVRRRLDEKETERGPVALIREVSRPLTPSRPYRDRRPIWTGLAGLAGLLAGVALAFMRTSQNEIIHEADQLAVSTRTPLLGLLPVVKTDTLRMGGECPIEQEHYRMLRTALLNRLQYQTGSVTQITSGSAGVGKTRVAIMLAKSLARCGKRVLLVDADVRAAGIAQQLGLRAEPGLAELLRGHAGDAEAIVHTETPGLSVLPARRSATGEEVELLANGVFGACLARWRASYDLILLDSPPVLPVADARILSQHADGTILVVREGHCRQAEILATLAYLGNAGGNLLGTVYIGQRTSSRYYGQAYAAYGAAYGSAPNAATLDLDVRQT